MVSYCEDWNLTLDLPIPGMLWFKRIYYAFVYIHMDNIRFLYRSKVLFNKLERTNRNFRYVCHY